MNTNKQIKYCVKDVYGIKRMYAVDEEIRQAISLFTGTSTITEQTMRGLKILGHTFKQVLPLDKDVI